MSATANPVVKGRCPACGGESLFLGDGGYVTCSRIDCTHPDAATSMLEFIPRITIGVAEVQPEQVIPAPDQMFQITEPVQVATLCVDPEEYARIYNAGYDEAVAQGLADYPSLAGDWLQSQRAAAVKPVVDAAVGYLTALAGVLHAEAQVQYLASQDSRNLVVARSRVSTWLSNLEGEVRRVRNELDDVTAGEQP